MEELEEGYNPGRCGKRRKRARAGDGSCGFYHGRGGHRVQGSGNCHHISESMRIEG